MLLRTVPVLLVSLTSLWAAPADTAERAYQAIRNDDLASLRTLIKASGVDARDKRGATPLMLAAAYGSLDAMKLLIDAGADVNAKNDFDATALLWCTYDLEKVRLLVNKGANVNTMSKQKRTPLLVAATHHGGAPVVKLLLDNGAATAVRDATGLSPLSAAADAADPISLKLILTKDPHPHPMDLGRALQNASAVGDVSMIKMLLAHGADVNATSPPQVGPGVKRGPVALGLFTPLILATAYGGMGAVQTLIDAGAKIDALDVRGMTPLMLAIATDRPDPGVVRLLVAKGASLTIKDRDGDTAVDWARKYNKPQVLQALGLPPAAAPAALSTKDKVPTLRTAVDRSLPLLQKSNDVFHNEGGCVACHSGNVASLALTAARANGFRVDEKAAKEQSETIRLTFLSQEQLLLQRLDPGGAADTLAYALFHLAVDNVPADRTTDAIIHNLASEQRTDGCWHRNAVARPPVEDGDFTITALGIRIYKVYAPSGRKAEFAGRTDRAAKWLAAAEPVTTEDRNFQLLGLHWANYDPAKRAEGIRKLLALQRADGGWGQTPELASDAYATGQTLYTLHELGIPVTGEAYRRGVEFLLRTQHADGSWYVKSRSAKFQPYFQSGFPHDHDQWISAAGTAWATTGLIYAAPVPSKTASR